MYWSKVSVGGLGPARGVNARDCWGTNLLFVQSDPKLFVLHGKHLSVLQRKSALTFSASDRGLDLFSGSWGLPGASASGGGK